MLQFSWKKIVFLDNLSQMNHIFFIEENDHIAEYNNKIDLSWDLQAVSEVHLIYNITHLLFVYVKVMNIFIFVEFSVFVIIR